MSYDLHAYPAHFIGEVASHELEEDYDSTEEAALSCLVMDDTIEFEEACFHCWVDLDGVVLVEPWLPYGLMDGLLDGRLAKVYVPTPEEEAIHDYWTEHAAWEDHFLWAEANLAR